MIYLDNCATTKPREEVINSIQKFSKDYFANPSSLHNLGMKVEEMVDESRKIVSKFLGASSSEIYFTSGGTESDNIFINGAIDRNKHFGNKIITTKLEHSAVLNVFKEYEKKGFEVCYLNSNEWGEVDLDELQKEVDGNTILVSIMHVNNELGTINDIKKCAEIIKNKNKNTIFHSDGVQAFGKIPVNVKELGVDGYSISGHKIHALKGIGVLYIKKDLKLKPLVFGGDQENGLRSGTENTLGIFSLKTAVEILNKNFSFELEHKRKLRDRIVSLIDDKIENYEINTPLDNSANSILNVSFPETRGEVILHFLERDEIYISTASACSSNHKVKTVLEKIGKDKNISEGSIKICVSYENTLEEMNYFVDKLKYAVEEIRDLTMR